MEWLWFLMMTLLLEQQLKRDWKKVKHWNRNSTFSSCAVNTIWHFCIICRLEMCVLCTFSCFHVVKISYRDKTAWVKCHLNLLKIFRTKWGLWQDWTSKYHLLYVQQKWEPFSLQITNISLLQLSSSHSENICHKTNICCHKCYRKQQEVPIKSCSLMWMNLR